MLKPDALQAKLLEAETNAVSDLQIHGLDAAVHIWDGWMIRMYLELTRAEAKRFRN